MDHIEIDNLCLDFFSSASTTPVRVLDIESCKIEQGSFTCVIGPSGCGKSTLLSVIAGYLPPTNGTVRVSGDPISGPSRDRMMVFQHSTLFPWLTARQNVQFGMRVGSNPKDKAEADRIADSMIALVGLEGKGDRYPAELSGGMRQRIEIARALAVESEILLMDEPLGALDALTRLHVQQQLLDIWNRTKKTIVLVTHDIAEAILFADQIIVMSSSPAKIREVIQVGLDRPRSRENQRFSVLGNHIAELLNATF